MTKSQSIESIEKATGRPWADWKQWLEKAGAHELTHPAIADLVYKELEGKIDSPGWWSQGVTVAYEQAIGRRAPGQRSDGTFELSVSKTVDGTRDEVFAGISDRLHAAAAGFAGKTIANVRTSVTPVRSYWKCDLDDDSKVTWSFEQKGEGKVLVAVTHTNLISEEQASGWREFWKNYLTEIMS